MSENDTPLARAAEMARERDSEVITNYVVEVRARDLGIRAQTPLQTHSRPWITWPDGSTPTPDEALARLCYQGALASRHTGWTHFRLVKRTAVITDEVVLEEGS
jgi:hypothetical protein